MGMPELSRWTVEALQLTLLLSAPALAAAILVGGAMAVVQAATQVQDAALAFVPRLVAVGAALALGGAWMGARLVEFTTVLWQALPRLMQ
jgi:flagellar biosynthetic protein FliQ